MKNKSRLIWFLLFGLALILTIPLAGIISDGLLNPITKLVWLIRNFFLSINQAILWGLMIIGLSVIAGINLHIEHIHIPIPRPHRSKRIGEVSQLAFWIRGAKRTYLARWQMARTLAELASKILLDGGADVDHAKQLQGPGWKPPERIQSYLMLALQTTAVTFRNKKKANPVNPDPEITSIIEYFESFMENAND